MDYKKEDHFKLAQDQLKLSLETTQEFFDMWTKNYQSAIGKLAQVPAFGPVREKQEKIMKSMPLYTNLYTAWIESNVNFQSVFTEAMKRTFEQTAEKLSESTKSGKLNMSPEIGKDLYKTWIDAYSETFKEFMRSGHFASDMGKLTSIFMDFQKYNREIIEENYLKPNNLPTKTEIEQINKEIYDLKKIVKELTKELQELSKEKGTLSPAPAKSETTVPVKSETTVPVKSETPVPVKSTPPAKSETPVPVKSGPLSKDNMPVSSAYPAKNKLSDKKETPK